MCVVCVITTVAIFEFYCMFPEYVLHQEIQDFSSEMHVCHIFSHNIKLHQTPPWAYHH